jgi:hypothetical protein
VVFGRKTGVSSKAEVSSQVLCNIYSITYLEARKMGRSNLIKSSGSWYFKPLIRVWETCSRGACFKRCLCRSDSSEVHQVVAEPRK